MFTGIIEATGRIKAIQRQPSGARIEIDAQSLDMGDVKLGDSIATNGICLTVTDFTTNSFSADVSLETLERTAFGNYQPGQRVNLEKAMLATSRFGGHIVSGHVDGLATVTAISERGNAWEYWLQVDKSLRAYIAEKGSVTIDGVSLTVNSVVDDKFRLTIVPHTRAETIIAEYGVGQQINLEVDVVARYVERLMQCREQTDAGSGISESLLRKTGFI
ncbi:riboflavin synthase [Thalassotalea mangrovi]|uniref:Riboflavin synthase n=1 Tax=Thalassotalea mangrovi TaxID=2572245 RepID=A0A4U1B3U1_9GAMM|nr:riboflavin synthase [Thalassotalea mangrovi]TKB44505.1 riboflavin synthase [Thalassotalea mangrovi]